MPHDQHKKSNADRLNDFFQVIKTIEETTLKTAKAWAKQIPENDEIKKTFKRLGLVTQEELESLMSRVVELESKIEELKKEKDSSHLQEK